MARERVTLYFDPDVLRQLRVAAARRGLKDSELVEEAVKEYIGINLLERIWARSAEDPLTEEEAMELAVKLTHEVRDEMRREAERKQGSRKAS